MVTKTHSSNKTKEVKSIQPKSEIQVKHVQMKTMVILRGCTVYWERLGDEKEWKRIFGAEMEVVCEGGNK